MLVVHDYYAALEGGGRLSSVLAQALDADLGFGFARRNHPFTQYAQALRQRSWQGRTRDLRAWRPLPLWQQWQLARAWQYRADWVEQYDTVIYSGFYTPLAALRRSSGNVLYCHTPPRFVYDQREFYLSRLPLPLRPLLQAFIRYLQPRYEQAARHMDCIVANSQHVRARIQRYLGLDATVVYPPCDIQRYAWQPNRGYYLSTARLDPLKRVDRIIQAFLHMPDQQLVVASGGPELARLRRLAGNAANIRFTGWVSERQWQDWLGHAIATIYIPAQEDFGMSPVESMAAGKPVIGVNEGGIPESVLPGATGLLLPQDCTPADIAQAVRALPPREAQAMRHACEQRAYSFRTARFIAEMRSIL